MRSRLPAAGGAAEASRLVFQACAAGRDEVHRARSASATRAAEIPNPKVCLKAGSVGGKLPRGHGAVARTEARSTKRPVPWGTTPSDLCRRFYVRVVRLGAAPRSCSHEQGSCRVSTLALPSAPCWFSLSATTRGRRWTAQNVSGARESPPLRVVHLQQADAADPGEVGIVVAPAR